MQLQQLLGALFLPHRLSAKSEQSREPSSTSHHLHSLTSLPLPTCQSRRVAVLVKSSLYLPSLVRKKANKEQPSGVLCSHSSLHPKLDSQTDMSDLMHLCSHEIHTSTEGGKAVRAVPSSRTAL